jgi:2-methylcitrate dehydratase PrpD
MSMTRGGVAQTIGAFVATARWDALPEQVRAAGRRSLLNMLGCALGSARAPAVEAALRVLLPLSGPAQATLAGRAERCDMPGAAFINAVSANLLDYDDTHLRTVIHPAAPVAAAALALAEQRALSGEALLHAVILGIEVACRIGNGVSPGHYARGWHITATCGVFGAAAACAALLRLDADQVAHALGIAASQSAGVVQNLPHAAKNVGVGNAARNGLFAALLAAEGYDAAPDAIEGALGWAHAMGDAPVVAEMTGGLGTRWEALANTFKPYPCGIVMHAVIDACLELRRVHALAAESIDSISVSGDQLLLDRGDRAVHTERDARVSIHHCAAVSFRFGAAGLAQFSEACVHDPAVVALRARTEARLRPDSPRGAATVTVRTTNGRRLEATVLHPRGSLEQPLSDAEIEAKLRDLASHGGFRGDADAIAAAVWRLESLDCVTTLAALLRPAPTSS